MKTFMSRLAPLFLLLCLLPACAELPGLAPERQTRETARADESLFQAAEASNRRQAYAQAYQSYAQYLERYPNGRHATEARLREAELLGFLGNWQGSLAAYQAMLARQPEAAVALKARYGIGPGLLQAGPVSRGLPDSGQPDRGHRPAPLPVVLHPGPVGGDCLKTE